MGSSSQDSFIPPFAGTPALGHHSHFPLPRDLINARYSAVPAFDLHYIPPIDDSSPAPQPRRFFLLIQHISAAARLLLLNAQQIPLPRIPSAWPTRLKPQNPTVWYPSSFHMTPRINLSIYLAIFFTLNSESTHPLSDLIPASLRIPVRRCADSSCTTNASLGVA